MYEKNNLRKRMAQSFDKNTITLTKAGETYNVYDKIQANREDTEIYPTLEKYGCLPTGMDEKQTMEYLKANVAEFTTNITLRDVNDMNNKAIEMFYKLPIEIRAKFDNDIKKFAQKGGEFTNNYIKEEKAKEKTRLDAIAKAEPEF